MHLTGIIIGDNFYQNPRTAIGRSNGAHRIATLLRKQKIKVEVLDFFNSWTFKELSKIVNSVSHLDFLGLSLGLGLLDSQKVNYFIFAMKQKFPNILIIAGGSVVLDNSYKDVDLYFKGFAEGAINDIIKYLYTNKFNPFYVQKITTHDIKNVVDCNKHYKNFDLINLATEYTENDFIDQYEVLTLETSRGCIFKCKFCSFPLTGKKKNEYIRLKENIKNELLENYKKYKVNKYLITDDTFNDNQIKVDLLYEISQELPFELNLMCYARVDLLSAFEKYNQLDKMIASGVKGVFFGIESLKLETSRIIGKGFAGEQLIKYLQDIKKRYPQLHITASFIAGLPNESAKEFEDNIDWAIKSNLIDAINVYPLYINVDNSVNYISPFSLNYENYGYKQMSESELQQINFNDTNRIKHKVPWKNNHMNFLDAEKLVNRIHRKAQANLKPSGWFGFVYSFHTSNVVELMHTRKKDFDWDKQVQVTDNFVKDYKNKKMNCLVQLYKNEN